MKIKVVNEADSSPITYGAAFIRTILFIIDGLFVYLVGAILIWTSDKKQRLGDRVAHTVVLTSVTGAQAPSFFSSIKGYWTILSQIAH